MFDFFSFNCNIALRMSYSTKIDLPITTHHYPPEDKK